MITVKLKRKIHTTAEAMHTLLCYVDQGNEQDFEFAGRETKGATFDTQRQYEKTLEKLGSETL